MHGALANRLNLLGWHTRISWESVLCHVKAVGGNRCF